MAWRFKTDNLGPRPEFNLQSTPLVVKGRNADVIAQLFNVFNTVNLSGIQTNAVPTTFGQASRAGAGRQAELAVRFAW